jgi:hypothetical protein
MPGEYSLCQLPPGSHVEKDPESELFSVTYTAEEVSVICETEHAPKNSVHSDGWVCMRVQGPFDLNTIGVLDSILMPLANEGVSVMAFSTYNTDYVLIRSEKIDRARRALLSAGHRLEEY